MVVAKAFKDLDRRRALVLKVENMHAIAVRAGGGIDDQIAPVIADRAPPAHVRRVGISHDLNVFALIGPQRVEIDRLVEVERGERLALFRRGIARIVKARAVLGPAQGRELHPFDLIAELFAGLHIHHADRAPV